MSFQHLDDAGASEQVELPKGRRGVATLRYASPTALTARDRDVLWSFFSRFVRRERDAFETKLLRCDEVFLGTTATGALVAFGAVDVLETTASGVGLGVLMTNWAALDPSARGQNVIQRVGLRPRGDDSKDGGRVQASRARCVEAASPTARASGCSSRGGWWTRCTAGRSPSRARRARGRRCG